jgi:hypothetical protein
MMDRKEPHKFELFAENKLRPLMFYNVVSDLWRGLVCKLLNDVQFAAFEAMRHYLLDPVRVATAVFRWISELLCKQSPERAVHPDMPHFFAYVWNTNQPQATGPFIHTALIQPHCFLDEERNVAFWQCAQFQQVVVFKGGRFDAKPMQPRPVTPSSQWPSFLDPQQFGLPQSIVDHAQRVVVPLVRAAMESNAEQKRPSGNVGSSMIERVALHDRALFASGTRSFRFLV